MAVHSILAVLTIVFVLERPLLLVGQAPARPIPAGTTIRANLRTPVRTASSQVGDDVVAIVARDAGMGDQVVLPRGSRLQGRVETIQRGTPTEGGRVRLVFREVQLPGGQRFNAWITNSFDAGKPRRNIRYAIFMAAGTTGGALVGGGNARVAGAIGGLLAGFLIAGSSNTKVQDLTLQSGQEIRLQLGEDLHIR